MHDIKLDKSPFQDFLGIQLKSVGDGIVEIHMPFREEFLRANDGSDWLHGGILGALIDIAGD